MRRVPPSLVAAAIALLACGDDATAPAPAAGIYSLRAIAEQRTPVLMRQQRGLHPGTGVSGSESVFLVAGTLTVRAAAAEEMVVVRRTDWNLDEGEDPASVLASEIVSGLEVTGSALTTGGGVRHPLRRRGDSLFIDMPPAPGAPASAATWLWVRNP